MSFGAFPNDPGLPASVKSPIQLVTAAAGIALQTSLVQGDANPAFAVLGDGTMRWGAGGGAAPDVSLTRVGANALRTGQMQASAGFVGDSVANFATGLFTVSHNGGLFVQNSGVGVWGHAVPAAQPAAPVTLADVIAIIRGCGLSA